MVLSAVFRVSYAGSEPANPLSFSRWFCFCVSAGQRELFRVDVRVPRAACDDMEEELKRLQVADAAAMLTDLVRREGLRRIVDGLRVGSLQGTDEKRADVTLGLADLREAYWRFADKECGYRRLVGRDQFCTAVAALDEARALGVDTPPQGEPTSGPVCGACQVPPADMICSRFVHPFVRASQTRGSFDRLLVRALCDAGHADEIGKDASRCRLGGHQCWETRVEVHQIEADEPLGPGALAEAIDSLDDAWRLAFGKAHRLVRIGRLSDAASLARPVADRDSFDSRLSTFADLLSRFEVPDDLLPAGAKIEKSHTLKRLEAALTKRVDAGVERVQRAVGILRDIVAVRVGAQHSGASADRTKALAQFGIATPIADYGAAWDALRRHAYAALLALRQVVREIGDAD